MLSRKICKKCYDECRTNLVVSYVDKDGDFDSDFENSVVACDAVMRFISTEDQPPEECYYILEQMLETHE